MSSAPQPAPYADFVRQESVASRDRAAAAALWERMLSPVPTLLGKLVSTASFRVDLTSEYSHPSLDRVLTPEVANRVLRDCHEQLFAEWIGLFLDEQRVEVRHYLATLQKESSRDLLMKTLGALIPPSVSTTARHAFLCDLEQILRSEILPDSADTAQTRDPWRGPATS